MAKNPSFIKEDFQDYIKKFKHIHFCMFIHEIFFCLNSAYRTAQCKSKRGGFKDTLPDDLLSTVLKVRHVTYVLCQID